MPYILRKMSRWSQQPSPYRNPHTCKKAGVPCEKVYYNEWEAIRDARKLGAVNPVGFDVVPVTLVELDPSSSEDRASVS